MTMELNKIFSLNYSQYFNKSTQDIPLLFLLNHSVNLTFTTTVICDSALFAQSSTWQGPNKAKKRRREHRQASDDESASG